MAKGQSKIMYVCQQCGSESPKWQGKCPDCGEWNTFSEIVVSDSRNGGGSKAVAPSMRSEGASKPQALPDIRADEFPRLTVEGDEFNRVMGGGIVPGSLVLISGDPGIGKSTLLLDVSAQVAATGNRVLYVSAEESVQQIKLRAERMGINTPTLFLLGEDDIEAVALHIEQMKPGLVVVDSIQTVFAPEMTSAAGSVTQVRESTSRLMHIAKRSHIPIFIVGHVTKEGNIAGPRVLEHMVDAVLYLEGDRFHQYRLLRAVKNRFGSTNEVGVFEMAAEGMIEVPNPSAIFLEERSAGVSGSAVAVTMEGTRPLLVEVQALTSKNAAGVNPRRNANGIDINRLHLLLAVLSKRLGMQLWDQDVYVNVIGGMKIDEPAVDLAVAVAIASSFRDVEVDPEMALIGEVGLSGELRNVGQLEWRLNEAAKLGFRRAIYPRTPGREPKIPPDLQGRGVDSLQMAIEAALTA